MLIGICGKANAGKDSVAKFIQECINCRIVHWADPLKEMLISYFGLNYEDVYTQEGKEKYNEYWGMKNREILQKFGTNACRDNFCVDVWIKTMELRIKNDIEKENILIADTRFDNEAEFIRKNDGIIIEVVRKSGTFLTKRLSEHSSENGISKEFITYVIYNEGTLQDLQEKVVKIINEIVARGKND